MAGLIVKGATIVDARGARSGDVRIEDGAVAEVGDVRGGTDEPALAAGGMFLTPGLVDCHVHLCFDAAPDSRAITRKTDAQLGIEATVAAGRTLLAGVTTARDCGGRGFVETHVRNAVRSGLVEGPRLYTSGHPVVMTGGHMNYFARQADGPDECRKAAREQLKAGADWIKVVATGGVTTPGVDPKAPQLSEDEIRAVVEEAAKVDKGVAAHAHGGGGIRNALRAGVRSIEHGSFVDAKGMRTMVRDRVFLVPTLVATRAMIDAGTEGGVPEFAVRKAEALDGERRKAFAACVKRKVLVAMGTDAGTPFNPHGDNARELELMVEAGMTPRQALVAATTTAARLLGVERGVGLVDRGYAADLLLLRRNPLDDPSAFRRDLAVVIQGGRIVRDVRKE